MNRSRMAPLPSIADILSGDLDALMQQSGNAEKFLDHVIREIQDSTAEVTAETAKAIAKERGLARRLQRNRAEHKQWQERAVEAIEAGDREPTCRALERKNEHQQFVRTLERELEAAIEANREFQDRLHSLRAKLGEAKAMHASRLARKHAGESESQTNGHDAHPLAAPKRHDTVETDDPVDERGIGPS